MTMQEGSVDDENSVHTLWYAISAGGAIILDNSCRARTWSDLSNSSASSNNNAIMALIYIYGTQHVVCIMKDSLSYNLYHRALSLCVLQPRGVLLLYEALCRCAACVRYQTCERAYTGGEILIGRVVKRQKVTLWMRTQANTKRNLNGFINTLSPTLNWPALHIKTCIYIYIQRAYQNMHSFEASQWCTILKK